MHATAREIIYFSRFPDVALPADVVTIHENLTRPGRCVVVIWGWDPIAEEYRQQSVVDAPSLEDARTYAPPKSERLPVPAEFGIEAWRAA